VHYLPCRKWKDMDIYLPDACFTQGTFFISWANTGQVWGK
jgi:hypothetical protein